LRNLLISGLTGFVGYNLQSFLGKHNNYNIIGFNRELKSSQLNSIDVVIHLAGKSHDIKNRSNFNDYYISNFLLTKKIFDEFLNSEANTFIFMSSVKAVADSSDIPIDEKCIPSPISDYGKSKLLAEQYLLNNISSNKSLYILRPCMIHGPKNRGNLNLLSNLISKRIPWILGSYNNSRSFCSVNNLCFVIKHLIDSEVILNGIYNVSDDHPLSTNDIVGLISFSQDKKPLIWNMPKILVLIIAKVGDLIPFPLNSEILKKLTESFLVNNEKIKKAIGTPLPLNSEEGMLKSLMHFQSSNK
jgi:nucleoside-diphosphate-sugar epimerase